MHSPSLTGCADRKHLLSPGVGLDTHITDIVSLIKYKDLIEILVGHSYGGMGITGVGGQVPRQNQGTRLLGCRSPQRRESLRMIAPEQIEPPYRGARTVDGIELVLWPMSSFARFRANAAESTHTRMLLAQ